MSMGTGVKPAAGPDRVVTMAMMGVRLGFVVAALIGVGHMFGLVESVGPFHLIAGILALLGALVAGVRMLVLGRGGGLPLLAVVIGVAGAVAMLTGMLGGFLHLLLMVAAVGMTEASAAKLKRG
ncbi:MAG TPA: hypothetical protein VD973_16975 [Symbiobacteriaceae bacterium]|nr:hypothetical protein [Symbiobacteriaceae bacterium]